MNNPSQTVPPSASRSGRAAADSHRTSPVPAWTTRPSQCHGPSVARDSTADARNVTASSGTMIRTNCWASARTASAATPNISADPPLTYV